MDQFVLWGSYCEDALKKRTPFREEHLNRLSLLKEEGILITLGPTNVIDMFLGYLNLEILNI